MAKSSYSWQNRFTLIKVFQELFTLAFKQI